MAFGMFLIDEGRYDEAIPLLDESLGLIDFDPETWNYLGVAYWHKERYDDALKAYERALSIDKNYAIVFNNRGSLFLSLFFKGRKSEDLAKAAADFRKAVDIDPVYASAWNGLGISLSQTGDIDRALAAWKKAVDLKPNFAYALFNLGLGNLGRGNKAEALGYFTRYKNLAYASLPPGEKAKLDELIEKCR